MSNVRKEFSDVIYPSMVIRSQEEAIQRLEEEVNKQAKVIQMYEKDNKKQKEALDKIKNVILYKYPVLDENMDDLKQELLELLEDLDE